MRVLGWGVGLVAALGVGAWGAGQGVAVATRQAVADRATSVMAAGFPTRIGVAVSALRLSDPATGLAGELPQVVASAPLWAPLRWQAGADLPLWVTLAGQRFELTGQGAQAQARFGLGADLPLRGGGLRLTAPALRYAPALAPSLAAQRLEIDLKEGEAPASYRVVGRVDALALPPRLAQVLAPGAHLPDVIETLSVDATVAFAQPLAALAPRAPVLRGVDLRDASLLWDGHRIAASGPVAVDPDGNLAGTITLAVSDWPVWLDLAQAAGLVVPERRAMLAAMASYLAGQSGDGTVRVPLSFADGRISLAAIPLGRAPRFQRQ